MKKYFKKFSIIFLMLLTIIGVGAIQNGSIANAATWGQLLTQPEDGWKRYDDTDSNIEYTKSVLFASGYSSFYMGSYHYSHEAEYSIKFSFYGSELRLLGYPAYNTKIKISFDGGKTFENFSANAITNSQPQSLVYEKIGLEKKVHDVIIANALTTFNVSDTFKLDAIDIDEDGYLGSYTDPSNDESITLDKSTMDLSIGDSGQLTATTTPAAVGVTWKSSDESVATVDSNGKVTGVKAGQATITATTADGSNLSASCTVTVTRGGNTDPNQPTTGDANLFIELVDGQIKQYSVSQDEINKFTTWFENRDKDHSLSATYKFAKGSYSDYVVHDQIDWFEVR